ncbi:hypothetical protein [Pseudofrankia sp. BMG5.37]|nr:hypothetical protein [Pseudofrankia sp. BMG5.37]MDT3444284.1 hypothetical protein [Pseudofrankia sp. BMG5.37]
MKLEGASVAVGRVAAPVRGLAGDVEGPAAQENLGRGAFAR